MASDRYTELIWELKSAADDLLKESNALGPTEERTARVVDAVRVILEDGLEGNRGVRPFVWSLVRRVGIAYPVTFHPSIDRVRALARQDALDREQVEDAWIKQALHEGVLTNLLKGIVRQFQIRAAYLSEAMICDKLRRKEIIDIVDTLRDIVQPVPDAPSVSSWSSEDSFVYTPRSMETDEGVDHHARHSFSGTGPVTLSSDDGGESEHAPKEDAKKKTIKSHFVAHDENEQDADHRVANDMEAHHGTKKKLSQIEETAVTTRITEIAPDKQGDHGADSCCSSTRSSQRVTDERLNVKTPDRPSLFGLISRTLSGTLSHTMVSDATQRNTSAVELNREEQITRFWSRHRSDSGSSNTLLREVEKDMGVTGGTAPVTAEERAKAAQLLAKELNKVSRLILQQHCTNGLPMSVNQYPLTKILHLYEEAFAMGLRACPLFQPTVPNMYLSDFEKIIPKESVTPYSVLSGLQKIYPHEYIGITMFSNSGARDETSEFCSWLKSCLVDGCLAQRVETVLDHQEFLRGWYYPQAIVINEDLIQEVIATCRGLQAVSIEEKIDRKTSPQSKRSDAQVASEEANSKAKAHVVLSPDDISHLAPLSPDAIDTRVALSDELEDNDSESDDKVDWITTQVQAPTPSRGPKMDSDASYKAVDSEADPTTESHSEGNKAIQSAEHGKGADSTTSTGNAARPPRDRSRTGRHESLTNRELPVHQQISIASANSGKLRLGDPARTSGSSNRHNRTLSVVSSCISGEEEEDWRGVWKDVDVVRHDVRMTQQGDHYVTYIIELMASDGTHWQTARRFSDLITLHKDLQKQEVDLPHSWSNLAKARIVTGKRRYSNEIIEARLALIRQCLWDLMTGYPESLIWTSIAEFLDAPLTLLRGTKSRQRCGSGSDEKIRDLIHDRIVNHLGSMQLIVDLPVQVTDEVLFEMQKGLCAGCQAYLPHIDHQKSVFRSSTSPRKCQYTELLYCHKCHQLDMAYLPARVLHCWDFAKYPVCVSAKSYLYSIFSSPVLCINAVNPGLLASVPVLAHLEFLRQNIVTQMDQLNAKGMDGKRIALAIEENAGSNKHLVQNADYWSLKDLGDISRGVFSRLPRWLEAVNKQIEAVVTLHGSK